MTPNPITPTTPANSSPRITAQPATPSTERIVLFRLGAQLFGLTAAQVLEVGRMVAFAAPTAESPLIQGILTYRGEVVPMLALHAFVNQPPPADLATCALVVAQATAEMLPIAIVVDEVVAVTDGREAAKSSSAERVGALAQLRIVRELITINRQPVFLLDLERLMAVASNPTR